MGHHVVFIIGDVTAKIGDPSGRSSERPPLTDDDIAHNLSGYQQQVTPFIDFERADLRFNGEWLNKVTLPELVGVLAHVPVSMSLQREDFRTRLADGHGLSVAEFVYSVVMALDSVAIDADVELGGVDQLLNLQMCRKVMEIREQTPEVVITTPLIEGTDGTGSKMSKCKGNYVGLSASPGRGLRPPDVHPRPPHRALPPAAHRVDRRRDPPRSPSAWRTAPRTRWPSSASSPARSSPPSTAWRPPRPPAPSSRPASPSAPSATPRTSPSSP